MTARPDDDALTWDGDDDPTLDVGPASKTDASETTDASPTASEELVLPEGYTAVGRGSEAVSTAPEAAEAESRADAAPEDDTTVRSMSSAALVGIGILAGVYLLLSLGWLLGAARLQLVAQLFLEPVAFQVTLWLAVLALPLWFVTVLWLTRGGRSWVRFALLVAGAVLLIPWPFVLAGVSL